MGTRIKNFNSTGVAPDGRLYAGDLVAMEDQYADQNNLAQTIGLGTVQVGEVGLQLLRYGSGEARLSGALRTDGILRGLGGLYAGAFTTTQRDALASASRPYGLVILNTTTNRLEINLGSSTSPSWQPLGGGAVTFGALGAIPAPATSNQNSFYFATDANGGTLYYSNGVTWTQVAPGLNQQMTPLDDSVTAAKIADQTITPTELAPSVQQALLPAGVVLDFAGSVAPAGFVICDGSAYSRTGFAALFAAIGVLHGAGDGTTTFNVPDYRGRVAVGVGTHTDVASVGLNDGQAAGNRRPKHKHSVNDPGHHHSIQAHQQFSGAAASGLDGSSGSYDTSIAQTGITVGPQSGAEPTDAPAYIVVNKIIKT